MNVIRAKCPNCWETDDCEVVETKNWYASKSPSGESPQGGQTTGVSGHNLKCPTCQNVFWHEIRGGTKAM
jgi:phage FluMu protein Com